LKQHRVDLDREERVFYEPGVLQTGKPGSGPRSRTKKNQTKGKKIAGEKNRGRTHNKAHASPKNESKGERKVRGNPSGRGKIGARQ